LLPLSFPTIPSVRAKKVLGAILLFVLGGFGLSACGHPVGFAPPASMTPALTPEAKQAEALFLKVWQTIQQDYLESDLNGQHWEGWRRRYQGKLHTLEDAYVAIDTLIASLNDPYTRFLRPVEFQDQTDAMESHLFGVGLQISLLKNQVHVVSIVEKSPASHSTIQSGDIILKVNQTVIAGLGVEEVAHRIRGPRGTSVTLELLRPKTQKKLTVTLQRDEIRLKSVHTSPLKQHPNLGYIRIASFISDTLQKEVETAFQSLGKKQGIILDLRGNYGGLLTSAVDLSDYLLDQGPIVSIEKKRFHQKDVLTSKAGMGYKGPLVLLIDQGSASASEILSGALKDYHRAKLVGKTTFGKGVVQRVMAMPSGTAMNLTVAEYKSPKGHRIHEVGVRPDYEVAFDRQAFLQGRDTQLEKAISLLQQAALAQTKPKQP
jgi:carboxyl-terminal processing protease